MAIVDNLIQRILLEGDKAITASLTALGAAGEKAFNGIAAASAIANKALAGMGGNLAKIENAAASFGRQARVVFERGSDAVGNFASNVTSLGRRLLILQATTALIGGAFIGVVKGAADAADKITEVADSLSLTTKRYQELTSASTEAGIGEDQFARSLGFLTRQIEGSQRETRQFAQSAEDLRENFSRTTSDIYRNFNRVTEGIERSQLAAEEAARDTALSDAWRANRRQIDDLNTSVRRSEDAFRRYNITIARTANGGVDLDKTLDNIADTVKRLGPTFDRAALAQQLFGTRNQRVVNLLSEGSEGLRKFQARARQLGHVVDELTLKMGARLSDAFDRLNTTISRNRIKILLPLFAPLTDLLDSLSLAIAQNADRMQAWVTTITNSVAPVIEDFIAILEGREEAVQAKWILEARDALIDFGVAAKQAITIVIGIIKALIFVLDGLALAINSVFGTNISGMTIALVLIFTKLLGLFSLMSGIVGLVVKGFILLGTVVGGLTVAIGILVGILSFVLVRALMNVDWGGLWKRAQDAFASIIQGAKDLWAAVVQAFDDGIAWVMDQWTIFVEWLKSIWNGVVETVALAWTRLKEISAGVLQWLKDAFTTVSTAIQSAWNIVFSWFEEKIRGLIDWFRRLIDKAREFIGMQGKTEGATAMARGGPVYGPGTETSDSIFARLSRGEFVLNAKAVRRYGLRLLQSLNSMRLPRGALAGFNAGGFVDPLRVGMPRMRFAEGGAVAPGSQRIVNLSIDGNEFPGLLAPESVADNLVRFATTRAVRSAGRKPGWYGGRK